jgi:hypothetical protein
MPTIIAAAREDGRKVGLGACLDRDAEHRDASQSPLPRGPASVFDRKVSFVVIHC